MVVHDRESQELWAEQRQKQEQEKPQEEKSRPRRWSVLAVQSIACVVILLMAFLLKLAGGSAYEELKQEFRHALADNQLMATLAGWFDGSSDGENSGESSVKALTFTEDSGPEISGLSPSDGEGSRGDG